MTATMKPFERIMAAIHIQESDRVPCALSLSYFVAKANGITIADFINDPDLCMELQQKTFEALGGSDLVNIMPPRSTDTPDKFAFLPIKVKLPGKTLPPDVIPQYVEKELMPPEDYKIVVDKGWFRYVEENLIPVAFPGSPVPNRR